FPAIIVDENDKWYEDFYYFNVYERLDCVDFENSEVDDYDPDSIIGQEVIKFKLRADVLENIEEERRLIVMLDEVVEAPLLVHQKLVDQLVQFNIEAFTFYKLSEYELGMEFRS
ncbi:hypothetical protein L4C34_17355, partial [Vibrio profundum]